MDFVFWFALCGVARPLCRPAAVCPFPSPFSMADWEYLGIFVLLSSSSPSNTVDAIVILFGSLAYWACCFVLRLS